MEVYIEITYLLNMIVLFMSFEILAFLLNLNITKKEFILYIFTFNISILFIFIDLFKGFLLFYFLGLSFYFFRKQVYIYYPIFVFIYISFISFFDFCFDEIIIFQGILVCEGINIPILLFLLVFVMIVVYFYIYYCSIRIKDKDDYVDVYFNNQQYHGFLDTGNKVFYKGYPLIFFNKQLLSDYHTIDYIQIKTALQKDYIPIIEVEHITINHQLLHHIYIGLIEELDYDCIISPTIMGGIL